MNTPNWSVETDKAHGANWKKWLGHLIGQPAIGLEVGTWRGESAAWMLEHIFTHEESEYYCVDHFRGSEEHHLAGVDCLPLEEIATATLAPYDGKAVILKGESNEVLRELNVIRQLRLDFAYIDGAHDAHNVLRDAVLAFELLKGGGVMIFDDYQWEVMPEPVERPKMAIDAFLACYAKQIEIIGLGGWQVAIRKR